MRELAAAAGLPVARKPESQDLCFLAGTRRAGRLHGRHARAAPGCPPPQAGDIVDREGRVLGRHRGHHRFTVGQRRGIGVAAPSRSTCWPRTRAATAWWSARARAWPPATWPWRPPACTGPPRRADSVRLRYHSPSIPCDVRGPAGERPAGGDHPALALRLGREVRAPAPGQTACLMRGDLVVGWGTIADA